MYVFDTDFIINFLKGVKKNVEIVSRLIKNDGKLFTTVINIYELTKGAYLSNYFQKHIEEIHEFKKYIRILEFDEESAMISARIFAGLEKKGTKINEGDIFIASICIKNSYTLLTDNVKHFNNIEGLSVYVN